MGPFADSDRDHFPPIPSTADEETGVQELYPSSIQDVVNEYYTKNKMVPREAGVDYTAATNTHSQEPPNQTGEGVSSETSSTPVKRPNVNSY